ncbi:hypothetical protein SCR05_09060 [Streptococcus canis]|uniref:hypothetical protein n=1 Tax=Streptococcus canis TaxID=1329 RepID=UPI00298DDC65|nr:hypothetical protein [Streptococcus canis]MDW7797695.1 hypothetical protein [Streptococcus canis]
MKRTFLGIGLILLAALLVFKEQLGLYQLPIWTILWIAFLTIGAIIQFSKRHFILGTLLAIWSLAQLNDIFHWINISSGLLMVVTILVAMGLLLIFKGSSLSGYYNRTISRYSNQQEGKSQGFSKVFGSFNRYINDNHFSEDSIDVVFGSSTVYFNEAEIEGERACYQVDAIFSSVTVYVPSHWRVDVKGDHVFSSVNQAPNYPAAEKVLVLDADLIFSSLDIHYL